MVMSCNLVLLYGSSQSVCPCPGPWFWDRLECRDYAGNHAERRGLWRRVQHRQIRRAPGNQLQQVKYRISSRFISLNGYVSRVESQETQEMSA